MLLSNARRSFQAWFCFPMTKNIFRFATSGSLAFIYGCAGVVGCPWSLSPLPVNLYRTAFHTSGVWIFMGLFPLGCSLVVSVAVWVCLFSREVFFLPGCLLPQIHSLFFPSQVFFFLSFFPRPCFYHSYFSSLNFLLHFTCLLSAKSRKRKGCCLARLSALFYKVASANQWSYLVSYV